MKARSFLLLLTALSCSRGVEIPAVREGLLDMGDTLEFGLRRLESAERIGLSPEGYVNNVVLSKFHGTYYCMWQSSERDEDTPDTRVMYSRSLDGRLWDAPTLLAAPTDSYFVSPGGWIQRGDSLAAILNYIDASDRSRGGVARYIVSHDGIRWTEPQPVLLADGAPVDGIFEQDPMGPGTSGSGGRTVGAVHFRPGLQVRPVFTDDPSGLRGWRKADFPVGAGKPLEPSQFRRPDGAIVMLFRDQASSFLKLASVSLDNGVSWTPAAMTGIPDSRSKQCAGNLPDGSAFMVWNPSAGKSRRCLALALSRDGICFDRAWLLAGPSGLPPHRFPGRYKTSGYNYPKAYVEPDVLWISISENKERPVIFRIPLPL